MTDRRKSRTFTPRRHLSPVGESRRDNQLPRPGDLVSDGHGGSYRVRDVQYRPRRNAQGERIGGREATRLLVEDHDDTVFVLAARRLEGAWRMVPRPQRQQLRRAA